MTAGRIDFSRVAAAALQSAEQLVQEWLPGGSFQGREYCCGDLSGGRGDSCRVNVETGRWADFAADARGGDLVSLYAAVFSLDQGAAARELAERLSVNAGPAQPVQGTEPKRRPNQQWIPVVPVPADAPAFRLSHHHYGQPVRSWAYRTATGELIGYVCRFEKSDGGKEILPACWARNDDGQRKWHWLAFPAPRPMYALDLLARDVARPVMVVEGEKCADAFNAAGRPEVAVTWPGGARAVGKVDWSPLAGRSVTIWPDRDDPGIDAAEAIAARLAELGCTGVRIVDVMTCYADRPAGFDVADALKAGESIDALPLREPDASRLGRKPRARAAPEGLSTAEDARASSSDPQEQRWRETRDTKVILGRDGPRDCRENVIYFLQDHPAWAGVLGFDEFAKRIVFRKRSPLGHDMNQEWGITDGEALGLWLAQLGRDRFLVRSTDTLLAAVRYVARLNAFHPVREFLAGCAERWDKVPRLDRWVVDWLGVQDTPYARLVGRFFPLNMVARVMDPGCVMRSVPVLEGAQERGKSSALRALAWPWFSDTMFRVGEKDAFQAIQGVWLYEVSELESFSRAEASAVKAFISSREDNFRAPYERQNEKHPRQTAFAASTNAAEYLRDWTGNTRFWPLTCTEIRIDAIEEHREQLLGEAAVAYARGDRRHPTAEERELHFANEEGLRMIAHSWVEPICDWLESHTRPRVSVHEVLTEGLKVDISRVGPQGTEAQTVGKVLAKLGWVKRRSGNETRGYVWERPQAEKGASPGIASAAHSGPGGEEEPPF